VFQYPNSAHYPSKAGECRSLESVGAGSFVVTHNFETPQQVASLTRALNQLYPFPTRPLRTRLIMIVMRTRRGQSRHARHRPQAALLRPRLLATGPANGGHGEVLCGLWGWLLAVPTNYAKEERVNARHASADERNVELDPGPESYPDALNCSMR
jgi:hypothetical protein